MGNSSTDASGIRCVAVTGASGFVGRRIVAQLLESEYKVRALTTHAGAAWDLLPASDDLALIEGDVLDSKTRESLVEGADAVIHLIGIHRENRFRGQTYERLHVRATRLMVEAAQQSSARRFIHMSSLGTRTEAVSRYHRSKHEAEIAVRESNLDWTIFRPSLIHGPDGEFMQMATRWVTGNSPAKFFLPYFEAFDKPQDNQRCGERARAARVQPVLVVDVARLFVGALSAPQSLGEVYAVGGPDVFTWPTLLTTIRDNTPHANESIKPWGVPSFIGVGVARAFGAVGLGSLLPFSADDAQMAIEDNCCSLAKVDAHFGFSPAPFVDSMREYAGTAHN